MDSNAVAIAALTLAGTMIAGLFKLLSANTRALERLVTSSDKVAAATVKGANEAKKRNGHLGDQNLKLATLITDQNKDVVSIKDSTSKTAEILGKSALIAAEDRDTLLNPTQHIEKQVVDKQIVKSK